MNKIWDQFDTDANDELNIHEFADFIDSKFPSQSKMTKEETVCLFKLIDINNNLTLQRSELVQFFSECLDFDDEEKMTF